MTEIAKNVHVTDTIVTHLLEDPHKWLDGLDGFEVRYVGGIHNLSTSDKKKWARDARGPLRVIESCTGREEVWFPPESKGPEYISLNKDGKLTSHLKFDRLQPALVQDINQKPVASGNLNFMVEFSVWYQDEHIHREPDKDANGPAVMSSKMRVAIPDDEYIAGIYFNLFREFWRDGEWQDTKISKLNILFVKERLNKPEIQEKAVEWISKNCDGGFFPFEDKLFGEEDEEFMFLTDICSKG